MICYSIPAATILTFSVSAAFSQPVPDSMAVEWQGKKMCENLYEDAQVRVLRCSFRPVRFRANIAIQATSATS